MAVTLEFERPILELEEKVAALHRYSQEHDLDLGPGLSALEAKLPDTRRKIFASLTPWEKIQLARHPQRPHPQDYVGAMFTDFLELCGDRRFADDRAIIGGFAKLDGRPVMVISTQKGRNLKQNMEVNFGCAHPEGYRKALRLMQLANKARVPIISLIDTPGAYPGIAAAERHIGESIAVNLREMFRLEVPLLCVITGEGGSGGALGICVGNRVLIMENAYYSVITPEGCAAILWRTGDAIPKAAQALKLTAPDLLKLGVVDAIIPEPLGGAHHDPAGATSLLKQALLDNLAELAALSGTKLRNSRYDRFRNLGVFEA
ncbi:MAG: acetyl-CoA carboxylase carboxyltransferase subunit alpha [Lentisphaeria bacterium]|jgi:acetyl-CoA carboxylase carboxyl transferase subunit alpha|nr:acetyl-CoA carboxylase carboxyltransferase subunit alpha [Lentisphaeria bacterium]